MSEVKRFEYNWAGRPLVIEIGEVAKQANGACLVTYGESTVLSAVCSSMARLLDFSAIFSQLWAIWAWNCLS